jgi:hypothetical protein
MTIDLIHFVSDPLEQRQIGLLSSRYGISARDELTEGTVGESIEFLLQHLFHLAQSPAILGMGGNVGHFFRICVQVVQLVGVERVGARLRPRYTAA